MHKSSMLRMQWFEENHARNLKKDKINILDIGSYEVNGSYKQIFNSERYEYTGLDMAAGPNVDIVPKNPYDWQELATDTFDIVISGQAFEHIEFFWVTMSEMARVLKKDGLLCIIAPNGFNEHRHPVDCYRFFTDGMIALARYVNLTPLHAHTNAAPRQDMREWYSENKADAMLVAKKEYSGNTQLVDLKRYQCKPPDQNTLLSGFEPYVPEHKPVKTLIGAVKRRMKH